MALRLLYSHLILFSSVLMHASSEYSSDEGLMTSITSPRVIDAIVGEQVFLNITKPAADQTQCLYRVNNGTDIDVKSPHKTNIKALDGEVCGVRISNISLEDRGLWRFTSKNGNGNYVRGMAYINVQDEEPSSDEKDIDSITTGITPEQTSYCYVLRPDQTKIDFPSHEKCEFPKLESESNPNGIWRIVAGIKGKTQEVTFDVNVEHKAEQIVTSIERNAATSTLNMKCKLLYSGETLKFCRFLRLSDDVGFNLEEGLGGDRYRYFGNGFENQECGISISNPDENDESPWKCFVGVDSKTIGAIVDGSDPKKASTQGDIETSDVYGLEKTNVNMLCKRNIPTDYCWFRDPSGQKISVSDREKPQETDKYRYYGTKIHLGECGLTIINATHNHSGTWSCHMGATHTAITDSVQEISVRITESPLVSTNLIHDAQLGTSLLLECRSIPEHVPLDYCRFVLADGTGFSINEQTTAKNPYMDNYYFNPNRKLTSGYCSIIVKKIDQSKHQGMWTCAARLAGSDRESSDEFHVNVFDNSGNNTIAIASLSGMAIVIIFVTAALFYTILKKNRQSYNVEPQQISAPQRVVRYVTEAETVSISSIHSVSSGHSSTEMNREQNPI